MNVEIVGCSTESPNDRGGVVLGDSLECDPHMLGKLVAAFPAEGRAPGLVEIASRTGPLVSQPFHLLFYIGCGHVASVSALEEWLRQRVPAVRAGNSETSM